MGNYLYNEDQRRALDGSIRAWQKRVLAGKATSCALCRNAQVGTIDLDDADKCAMFCIYGSRATRCSASWSPWNNTECITRDISTHEPDPDAQPMLDSLLWTRELYYGVNSPYP